MHPITRTATRTIAGVVACSAAVTLAVVGVRASSPSSTTLTAAPSAADLDSLASAAATATGGSSSDGAGLRALAADLRAARQLSGDARRAALADIRRKAAAGSYGSGVQRRTERRDDRRQVVLALLPQQLQDDLAAVREAPADQRPAMRAKIMSDALAGTYGDQVKAAAEKLQQLRHR